MTLDLAQLDQAEKAAEIFKASAEELAVLVGAGWAFRKYVLRKEDELRIEFLVDVGFVGTQGGYWVAEVLGLLCNKGLVPYQVHDLYFDLKSLDEKDPMVRGSDDIKQQLNFPHVVEGKTLWLPGPNSSSGEDRLAILPPGVSMRYNHVCAVPMSARFVLVHGVLTLDKKGSLTSRADRVVRVPEASGTMPRA
jgi:hypothetical protein